nr:chromodomain-helicase-DNA-binding protein 3-like isoform X4 [Tanacetum cinerariifolium]
MDTLRQFSSMSISEKRNTLTLLAKELKMRKRKLVKRKLVKLGDLGKEESSNTENRDTKPKMKLNGHLYKKMFQKVAQKQKMMLLNQVDDKIVEGFCAKRSCTGPKRKRKKRRIALLSERFGFGKREFAKEPSHILLMDDSKHSLSGLCEICISGGELLLCSGQGCGKSFHRACLDPPLPHVPHGPWHCGSCTKNAIESGSVALSDFQFEVPSKTRNHVLPYVNKLRDYWHRGHSAVFFDEQERLLKAVIFVLSLLDNVRRPILIIAATRALSEWEAEFSKWSRFINVVTYKGSEYARAAIRNLEFYDENESITFQVLLSSPDVIVEDMEMLDRIKWELIVIDECQRPLMWSHINKIRRLDAHMILLTISDKEVDTRQRYHDILSLLDSRYKAGHMKGTTDTETLKSKLSPFILSSCLRDDSSLQDIITETQKCCDHPYLVDPNLRNSSEEDASIDSLDVDINVSGKLQLLDKFLSEIKQCSFRVVVLFQPVDNSEKICIGDILDDLVDRRFGQDSYIRIGKISTKSDRQKKKQSLEMFNNVETRMFICLLDYRVCHSSVHLSRMDVAILFNGDWNSSNDIRALRKITIGSHSQQLKVFRLYSSFTVEEKALMIMKEGVTMETNITANICHQLLAWGASYLLSKIGSENVFSSLLDDVVNELSSVLRDTSSKTEHTKLSIISKAQINDGTYSSSTKLLGETETEAHTKESWLTEEYLIENGPSDFWSNLLKDSENRQKNPCYRISRRVQKSPQNPCYLIEGYKPKSKKKDIGETISPSVRKKARSKRKRRVHIRGYQSPEMSNTLHQGGIQRDALSFNISPIQPAPQIPIASGSRTNEAEQCQSNEPLDIELERIQKEREQVTRLHKEKKLMLITECEKEIVEIRKKYDAIISESEMSLTDQLKIFEDYHELVNANKLLAEFIIHHCDDTLNLHGPDKDTSSIAAPQVPASATVGPANPSSTSFRPVNLCSTNVLTTRFSGQNIGMRGLRAPAPHLRSPSLFASVHNLPATRGPCLEPLPTLSNLETLPHIQTTPNTEVHQVDLKNIPKLPMEFDKY